MLELMITVFIITVGIGSISGLITYTLSYTSFNSSKLIASYLAQEGIEIVRNIVDTNLIEGETWSEGLQAFCVTGCIVDYNHSYGPTQEDPNPPSFADQYLNIDSSNFYGYSSGPQTKFQRKITIQDILATPEDDLAVIVEVLWQEKGKDYKISAQENLYNWRQ